MLTFKSSKQIRSVGSSTCTRRTHTYVPKWRFPSRATNDLIREVQKYPKDWKDKYYINKNKDTCELKLKKEYNNVMEKYSIKSLTPAQILARGQKLPRNLIPDGPYLEHQFEKQDKTTISKKFDEIIKRELNQKYLNFQNTSALVFKFKCDINPQKLKKDGSFPASQKFHNFPNKFNYPENMKIRHFFFTEQEQFQEILISKGYNVSNLDGTAARKMMTQRFAPNLVATLEKSTLKKLTKDDRYTGKLGLHMPSIKNKTAANIQETEKLEEWILEMDKIINTSVDIVIDNRNFEIPFADGSMKEEQIIENANSIILSMYYYSNNIRDLKICIDDDVKEDNFDIDYDFTGHSRKELYMAQGGKVHEGGKRKDKRKKKDKNVETES